MGYIGSILIPASFVFTIALLGVFVALVQSTQLQKFINEKDYFVEWSYTMQEWEEYLANDSKIKSKAAIIFAIVISVFFLFTGLIASSSFGHPEMFGVYFGIAVVFNFFLFTRFKKVRQRRKAHPMLILGKKSYYLGGIFHSWGGRKSRMESIELMPKTNLLHEIRISYSYPSKYGRTTAFTKFPVPGAKEAEAHTLIEILKRTNGLI